MYLKKTYVLLGIGVGVGVFTCAIHLLHRKNKEEILKTRQHVRVSRIVKIPKTLVGHVLGRHGSNIKRIREETKARIVFDDQGDDFSVATVSGTAEEVEDAVNEINAVITSRHGIVTREIAIADNASDSIFKNGNIIRQICDMTRAKITFDFVPSKKKDTSAMKVIVKGKKEEVDAAMDFIDELVSEVQLKQNKSVHVAGRALPNNLGLLPTSVKYNLPCEKLIPSHDDGYVDVYVSAVDTPNKFWVQICGFKSIQLDKLATEMTEFYEDEKNKPKFLIENINVGDTIAAYCEGDRSWYRAQVIKINEEEDKKTIYVFYVDFGDCAILKLDCVGILKPDFLSIPFQAIECSIADVEPVDNEWTQEATEEFQKMVYLGSWKVIMAKPVKQEVNKNEVPSKNTVQFVHLLDTNTASDINISSELVAKGYAKFKN